MAGSELKDALIVMVREHGFEQVRQSLSEIGQSKRNHAGRAKSAKRTVRVAAKPSRGKRPKLTASQYVAKMEVPPEKAWPVAELARRFEGKTFLPSFHDVLAFLQRYDVDGPASKSRANAIPRVFKLLVLLEAGEIQTIIDSGAFSGPSRLGPIADAIRRNGRAAASHGERRSLPSTPIEA